MARRSFGGLNLQIMQMIKRQEELCINITMTTSTIQLGGTKKKAAMESQRTSGQSTQTTTTILKLRAITMVSLLLIAIELHLARS